MRKTEGNAGGLGEGMMVEIAGICTACFTGFNANAGVGRVQEFSSIARTRAG